MIESFHSGEVDAARALKHSIPVVSREVISIYNKLNLCLAL
jgi:hypothetical protein